VRDIQGEAACRAAARALGARLDGRQRVAALTGAGISTAAGIPDFRGPQGIYVTRQYDPDIFDIDVFLRDPRPFYDFTRDLLTLQETTTPSFTHSLLARLEAEAHLEGVVTQNIDGLHQRAGSRCVIEIHGGFNLTHCLSCRREFPLPTLRELVQREDVPRCPECAGLLKPDVVFFGEAVKGMDEAAALVARSDLLLVIGSSLLVYPAAGLPALAHGEVLVITRGEVALPRAATRVDADIDTFFRDVAAALA
jgi:NAD-dependent deacetylase